MAVGVRCQQVTKRYGAQTVLSGLDWTVDQGVVAGLVGDSGTGKTTLLRIIAGLEPCSGGRVLLAPPGAPAAARSVTIGMVFQNLGLWPHLTARRQVEFVLTGTSRKTRRQRAEQALAETQLPRAAWERRPGQLSGGEAQRVALARALVVNPDLLLLDEPLSQLDMGRRGELLDLIRTLVRARNTTVLYVTHSWPEVLELCDRLAVLDDGRVVQEDTTAAVFQRPASAAVARLTGPVAEIPAAWREAGRIDCPAAAPGPAEGAHWLVRPHHVRFGDPRGRNCWRVVGRQPHGSGWRVTLRAEDSPWEVLTHEQPQPGALVAVLIAAPADFQRIRGDNEGAD